MRKYEEMLEDIKNTLGEIEFERARFLLCIDDMREEMLNQTGEEIQTGRKFSEMKIPEEISEMTTQ